MILSKIFYDENHFTSKQTVENYHMHLKKKMTFDNMKKNHVFTQHIRFGLVLVFCYFIKAHFKDSLRHYFFFLKP
jgi:hypothetical protein